MMSKLTRMILLLLLLLLAVPGVQPAAAQDLPAVPSAPDSHCRGVGPVPLNSPDFCGCTWGNVYYRGEPVEGVAVRLAYADSDTVDTTSPDAVGGGLEAPFFSLTGHTLGARKGDVMTLTVDFAGQTIARSFRAWPGSDGEQQVNLVLPPAGAWEPALVAGGYGRALAYVGGTLWAGGEAGLATLDVTQGVSATLALPWPGATVNALAADGQGDLWVAASAGVARRAGGNWEPATVPFSGTAQALAIDPTNGALWIGGDDGTIAVFTTSWQTVYTATHPVRGLAVDDDGRVWAATWGGGVLRQDQAGQSPAIPWTTLHVADGIASENVYAVVASKGFIWLGTGPYLSGLGAKGGISRYDLAAESWQSYGRAHGLPADSVFTDAPAHVYALAVDNRGVPWAGTAAGIYFMGSDGFWLQDRPAQGEAVTALGLFGATLFAGRAAAVDRLTAVQPVLPTVELAATGNQAVTGDEVITVEATTPSAGVVAWEWRSDRDGPLCTTADECVLPATALTPGEHIIQVRVQDGLGAWSAPQETKIMVLAKRLFMSFLQP